MNNNLSQSNKSYDFLEAPASWNTRYLDTNGFECQITLRGENGTELLAKGNTAIAFLIDNHCIPSSYSRNGRHSDDTANTGRNKEEKQPVEPASICPIHHCGMKRWEKDGHVWYSHKVDGKWCTGK